jgi:YD repeat-containing protein
MLRPSEIDAALLRGARERSAHRIPPAQAATTAAGRTAQSLPGDPSASGTGINHWWRYQEQSLPGGGGRMMVNVGTGNLIVQSDDMLVPHKGIAMAFRRTYNSQSPPTFSGDLQTYTTMYGNGWTNTFDAHLIRTSPGHFTVFDIDGARYDYVTSAGHSISSPPGDHSKLDWDGNCGITWTKKSGTIYYFYNVNSTQTPCPAIGTMGGYAGRLYQIIGRNRNTYITFSYAWDNGDASITGKISTITATTESGMTATLSFADVNGRRLLQSLTFPDGSTNVQYYYDTSGNMMYVSRPPNNASGTRSWLNYGYTTIGSDQILFNYSSPRWCSNPTGCGYDGAWVLFLFNGATAATSTFSEFSYAATLNPTIADGTNTPLYSGYQPAGLNYSLLRTEYYTTGVSTPTYRDTDGHMTNWVVDGLGRPTQTQECTASTNQGQQCTGTWVVTNETWDANNNLVSEVDPRGNQTDYAYDVDGNTVAVAAPPPSPGAFRPTQLFTYTAQDNISAYCDPIATHGIGGDWVSPPTAPIPGQGGLCPQTTVATQYQWSTPANEPFGELTASISPATAAAPLGYQRTFSYDTGPQGGNDYGLPTRVAGASIAQSIDSTTPNRQPQQTFWYDTNGNLVCYGTGNGQWLLAYDSLGRLTSAADPDDFSSGTGICAKTGAQPNWNTTARTSYFPDGSLASKSTASQIANAIATTFTYDLDGNVTTETHHYGCMSTASCTAGVTQKWYDGADRLVEVQQPYDANDIQAYPWSTRYIYDISNGGVTPYRGMGLAGYGNLVVTQELLSGTVWAPETTYNTTYPLSTGTWTAVRATSFDGIDRAVSSYEAAFGDQPKLTNTYDAPNYPGLLTSVRLATGEVKTYTYDGLGRMTDTTYPNDPGGSVTPSIHQIYDAAGHVVSRSTSALGSQTVTYDAAGSITSLTEPPSLGGGTIGYHYYADGTRSDVTYAGAPYQLSTVAQYAYRNDGKRETLQLANASRFGWSYTAAGRPTSQSDPYTGTTFHPDATYPSGKSTRLLYPSSMVFSARSLSYDTYGRVAGLVLPETFSYSFPSSQYDLEDAVAQETRNAPNSQTALVNACERTNIRKEQIAFPRSVSCAGVLGPIVANLNGAILVSGAGPGVSSGTSNGGAWTLDARSGMKLGNQVTDGRGLITGSQYFYDASGRMVQDNEAVDAPCPAGYFYTGSMQNPYCYSYGSRTKAYDAENRLRSDVYPYSDPTRPTSTSYGTSYGDYWMELNSGFYQPANLTVDYDPSSHPTRITQYHPDWGTTETLVWLWDGNDRFLQCTLVNGQCAQLTFSLEGLADYDPQAAQATVYDRNLWGLVVSSHTATDFSSWTEAHGPGAQTMPRAAVGTCSTGDASDSGSCAKLRYGKLTNDGWTIDNDTWQGVRSIDLSVGQWNTPDAYAGEVHDPMSQRPYVWNHNNPYAYSDPSGYDAIVTVQGNNVSIEIPVVFSNGTEAQHRAFKAAIERQWNGNFGRYHVSTKVTNGPSNTVSFDSSLERSFAFGQGHFDNTTIGKDVSDARHEAGHLMGLRDEYKETVDANGKTTAVATDPKFLKNIMGPNAKGGNGTEVTPGQIEQIIASPQNIVHMNPH